MTVLMLISSVTFAKESNANNSCVVKLKSLKGKSVSLYEKGQKNPFANGITIDVLEPESKTGASSSTVKAQIQGALVTDALSADILRSQASLDLKSNDCNLKLSENDFNLNSLTFSTKNKDVKIDIGGLIQELSYSEQ